MILGNSHWPSYYLARGLAQSLYVVIPGMLIEVIALRVWAREGRQGEPPRRVSWRRALWLALMANLASTAFGFTFFAWGPPFFLLPELPALIAHFLVTCAIELFVYLRMLRRVGWGLLAAVAIGNALSYALMAVAPKLSG
jgi:hypothetical protein